MSSELPTDHPVPHKGIGRNGRLTVEERKEIIERLKAGEGAAALAREFGVSRQAVHSLRERTLNPNSNYQKNILRSRLAPVQRARLIEVLRTTTPVDHGVEGEGHGHPERWNSERVLALGRRLFDKRLYLKTIRQCIQEACPDRRWAPNARPEPPKPPDIRDLSPEMADDEEFVKYYFSPLCQQIRQREYEWELREYEKRQTEEGTKKRGRGRPPKPKPDAPSAATDDDEELFDGSKPLPEIAGNAALLPRHPAAPGRRVGKHASSKGSPFTKSKKRKKPKKR